MALSANIPIKCTAKPNSKQFYIFLDTLVAPSVSPLVGKFDNLIAKHIPDTSLKYSCLNENKPHTMVIEIQ